jgi:hypothetical protein
MAVLEKIRRGSAWIGKSIADHLIETALGAVSLAGIIAAIAFLRASIRTEWTCVLSDSCTVTGWTVGVGILISLGLLAAVIWLALRRRVPSLPTTETAPTGDAWPRLSALDRGVMSEILADGRIYNVKIFRAEVRDCANLADDFYAFFRQLNWQVQEPRGLLPWHRHRGIRLETMPDHINGREDRNIQERSGVLLMRRALSAIGLEALCGSRGGDDDFSVYLVIGIKP